MLSEALQRNAKHEATLSNISDFFCSHAQPRLLGLHSHEQTLHNIVHKITSDIPRRLLQHRDGEAEGFTRQYRLTRLVWIEHFRHVTDAIAWEKKLKALAPQSENCAH
jgi:hypothetical protein